MVREIERDGMVSHDVTLTLVVSVRSDQCSWQILDAFRLDTNVSSSILSCDSILR
jgi:hypothetical protein